MEVKPKEKELTKNQREENLEKNVKYLMTRRVKYLIKYLCLYKIYSLILSLFFIDRRHSKEGITISAVIIKNIPQSPFNQSTKEPEEEANKVLPAVPIDASNANCVAV